MSGKISLKRKRVLYIVRCLAEGRKSTEIAKELCRDHRTVKRFIANANQTRKRCDKGVKRKIYADAKCLPSNEKLWNSRSSLTSKYLSNTRYRILDTVAKPAMKPIHPPLTTWHRNQRLELAKKYVKTDFQTVLSTDECRATLDGSDGWCRGWLVNGCSKASRVRRHAIRWWWCHVLGLDNWQWACWPVQSTRWCKDEHTNVQKLSSR